MKALSSCKLRLVAACCLIPTAWAWIPAMADTGGGGKLMTPYADPDKVSEADLLKVKTISARCRDATIPLDRPDFPPRANHLALVVAKRGMISGDPMYKFEGKDEAGKPTSIDFSDIKEFKVRRFEKKDCLLEITRFPTIAPKDLLQKKPSYSDLVTNYTSTILLRLNVDRPDGDLAIAGEDWTGKRELISKVRQIRPNSAVVLHYGRSKEIDGTGDAIWFATHSVIQDTNYPYRLIFGK